MSDNYHYKEEDCVGARLSSSCYPSVFKTLLTIKIRNVDLQTGLSIVKSISNEFFIQDISIKTRGIRGCSGT